MSNYWFLVFSGKFRLLAVGNGNSGKYVRNKQALNITKLNTKTFLLRDVPLRFGACPFEVCRL